MNEELKDNQNSEITEVSVPEIKTETPTPNVINTPKSKMMPLLLVLNVLMLIGLIALFFLYTKKSGK